MSGRQWLLFLSLLLCIGGCASAFAAIDRFFGSKPGDPNTAPIHDLYVDHPLFLLFDGGALHDGASQDAGVFEGGAS